MEGTAACMKAEGLMGYVQKGRHLGLFLKHGGVKILGKLIYVKAEGL